MKPSVVIVSLWANLALAAVLAWRPSLAPVEVRDFFARHFTTGSAPARPALEKKPIAATARPKLWTTVHSEEPAVYIARLRAAGFPPAVIRALVAAEIAARYEAHLRPLRDPDPNTPFWKLPSMFYSSGDKRLEEINQLYREQSRALREAFKDEFFASDDVSAGQRRQFGDLPRSKIDALQRIEDDYSEMTSAAKTASQGIILEEDREKLALLAREKRADLLTVLTPEELAAYELRTSPTTNFLRNRLGNFDVTETEFRAIFNAQQILNAKFPGSFDAIDYQARLEATQVFHDQVRAGLGEARYADYVRETSSDFQQLSRLAQRESIPRESMLLAYNVRDTVAQESNRIFDDASLDVAGKRAALQALAQTARTRILSTLGPAAGPEFVRISDSWLSNVERGSAVSFAANKSFAIVSDRGSLTSSGSPDYRRLPPR